MYFNKQSYFYSKLKEQNKSQKNSANIYHYCQNQTRPQTSCLRDAEGRRRSAGDEFVSKHVDNVCHLYKKNTGHIY